MGGDENRQTFEDKLEKQMMSQFMLHVDKYVANITRELTEVMGKLQTQMTNSTKLISEQSVVIEGLRNQIKERDEKMMNRRGRHRHHHGRGKHGHRHYHQLELQ